MASKRSLLALLVWLAVTPTARGWDWPEPGGGPLNDNATSDVEPPRTEPVERWRAQFDELLGQPVVSGGLVYVCGRRGRATRLHAFLVETGEEFSSVKVQTTSFAHVSVHATTVVVVTPSRLTTFERRKKTLKRSRTIKGNYSGPATLAPGLAAVAGRGRVFVYDLRSGDLLHERGGLAVKPVLLEGVRGSALLYFPTKAGKASRGGLQRIILEGVGTRSPVARGAGHSQFTMAFASGGQQPRLLALGSDGMLLVACERAVRAVGGGATPFLFWPTGRSNALPSIARDPSVWREVLYGRTAEGMLVQQSFGAPGHGLLPAGDRPPGAVDGPITCARGVLLLGNYALDLESSRVLWTVPDLEFDGPLVPAADGLVVFHDGNGALVAAGAEGPEATESAGASAMLLAPTLPGSGDAVVLVDGTRIPATTEPGEGGAVRLLPTDGGEAIEIARERVCAIESGGAVEVVGEPYGLALATRSALELALAHDLESVFASCAKRGLVSEASRLLEEMRERGLSAHEVRLLEVKIAGKKESVAGNRDRQLVGVRRDEERVRAKALARAIAAARWLAEASLPLEASDILARSIFIWPGDDLPASAFARLRPVAVALIPAHFPWPDEEDAWKRWLLWAPEIAPAGARFLGPDEIPDLGDKPSIWRRRTIALRTKNILLLSRSDDPGIVGACLRHGEASIRTLDSVLDNPPRGGEAPLEMRIHRSRSDYLAEDLGDGSKASEWSLGFYSPGLRASRFHVPDETTSLHAGRALHEVVSHELTHQYIAERWRALGERRMRSPVTRGFWLVEGFARFIEDQSLEMGRRGQRLDDATVQSVEAAAELARQKKLIKFEDFFEAQQVGFLQLPEEDAARVRLRSTLVTVMYSAKSLFYEQAGALVFFLVNRRGDEGRERFLAVLRDHYRGETEAGSWSKLGFESARVLEAAFLVFLRNPTAGG